MLVGGSKNMEKSSKPDHESFGLSDFDWTLPLHHSCDHALEVVFVLLKKTVL